MNKKTLNRSPWIIFLLGMFLLGMNVPLIAAFYADVPWYVAGTIFAGCSASYIAGRIASDIKWYSNAKPTGVSPDENGKSDKN